MIQKDVRRHSPRHSVRLHADLLAELGVDTLEWTHGNRSCVDACKARWTADDAGMPEFTVELLLTTPTVTVRDVCRPGIGQHKSAEERASATHLVFPYRGVYVRHLGDDEAVAEASQVLFFNANESYQVSHPIPGGDASLVVVVEEAMLRELSPKALLRDGAALAFRQQRLRIDPRAQALVALLR